MKKDFGKWHHIKREIHENTGHHFYREREVHWCAFGANIGFEMDGKGVPFTRPILVLKGFSREMCLCVPLTMLEKQGKFYHKVTLNDGISRNAVLSQVRIVDTKRLTSFIGEVSEVEFKSIKQALIRIIE